MIVLRLDVLHGDRPRPHRISDLYHDVIALLLELAACLYGDLFDLDLIKIRDEQPVGRALSSFDAEKQTQARPPSQVSGVYHAGEGCAKI